MIDPTQELAFQNDVIAQLRAAGWKLGSARSPHGVCLLHVRKA